MPQTIDIKTVDDLEIVKQAILNNIEFELGEVQTIKHIIKLDGGRFTDYDVNYITSDVAKIILSYQKNYDKLLDEFESKFKITFSREEREIKFQIEKGSLKILKNLFSKETIMSLSDTKKMIAIIAVAGIIVFAIPLTIYVNNLSSETQAQKEIKLKELEGQDRQSEREATEKYFNGILEVTKLLAENKKIQDALNNPVKETLSILKDDEVYVTHNDTKLKNGDASKFEYVQPTTDDIEDEIIDLYHIDNYHFRSDDKSFKIAGIKKEISSMTLSPEKRIKLIIKAENQEQVKLKIKTIKDRATNKIKQAFILDYIEN